MKTKYLNIRLLIGIILSMFGGLCGIFIPIILKEYIDNIKSIHTIRDIYYIIFLFIAQTILTTFGTYLTSIVGEGYVATYRTNLFKHLLYLPTTFFDDTKSGELASRIVNDTATIRNFVTVALPNFITSLVVFFGSVTALFLLDWKLSTLMIILLLMLSLIILPLSKILGKYSKINQNGISKLTGLISEVFSQVRLIKSEVAEKDTELRQQKQVTEIYNISIKADLIRAIINPIVFLFLFGMIAIVFGYGGARVNEGTLTIGTLISFLVYLFQILNPTNAIINFSNEYNTMRGATEKLKELLLVPSEFAKNKTSDVVNLEDLNGNLVLHNVNFSYGKNKILKNLSMTIKPFQKTAIVGPSGAGKTTILTILNRIYPVKDGKITINNKNINNFNIYDWRRRFAVVLQEPEVLSGTIKENLEFGLDYKPLKRDLELALKKAFLIDDVRKMPNGIDTNIGEKGVKLSGGQLQRLQIAKVFLKNPEIILLDEATANLDSNSENYIEKSLGINFANKRIVVVAHRLATIIDADIIYFIENGIISGVGTHKELFEKHKMYKKYVLEQFYKEKDRTEEE